MISRKISRRWSRGLLEHCLASGRDPSTMADELDAFIALVRSSHQWEVFINNPSVPFTTREKALEEIVGGSRMSEDLRRFLLTIFRKKRFHYVGRIAEAFRELVDRHLGRQPAVITSARPLEPGEVAAITEALERNLRLKIKSVTTVDPAILGGFIARVGSLQFDVSVKGQLRRFIASQPGS